MPQEGDDLAAPRLRNALRIAPYKPDMAPPLKVDPNEPLFLLEVCISGILDLGITRTFFKVSAKRYASTPCRKLHCSLVVVCSKSDESYRARTPDCNQAANYSLLRLLEVGFICLGWKTWASNDKSHFIG